MVAGDPRVFPEPVFTCAQCISANLLRTVFATSEVTLEVVASAMTLRSISEVLDALIDAVKDCVITFYKILLCENLQCGSKNECRCWLLGRCHEEDNRCDKHSVVRSRAEPPRHSDIDTCTVLFQWSPCTAILQEAAD